MNLYWKGYFVGALLAIPGYFFGKFVAACKFLKDLNHLKELLEKKKETCQ